MALAWSGSAPTLVMMPASVSPRPTFTTFSSAAVEEIVGDLV